MKVSLCHSVIHQEKWPWPLDSAEGLSVRHMYKISTSTRYQHKVGLN